MIIGVSKEKYPGERRVPMIPETVKSLIGLGAEIVIESGMGLAAGFVDEDYKKSGARVEKTRDKLLADSDIIISIRAPGLEEVPLMKKGAVYISFLDPFNSRQLIQKMAASGINAVSMELIPRISRAQKMDALSSQANLAGYAAVILAAERIAKILPMMMTPAGTIPPARIFVIGAGVAGLQAIATAKRLGAVVDAFDTRPEVAEQIQSLGARFVKINLGETGSTKAGYAKQLSDQQIRLQREAMAKYCAAADIVITTAQVFGKRAPLIVTGEMIRGMRPGSVIVDLAVESGGNVEGSEVDKEIEIGSVKIIGMANLPARVTVDASRVYSNNIGAFIEEFWNKETGRFVLNLEDEIIKGSLVTYDGKIVNEMLLKIYEGGK